MIIGIDGNEANVEKKVGVSEFAFELLKVFASKKIPHIQFVVYLKHSPGKDLPGENNYFSHKVFGPSRLWTQIALPFHLFTQQPVPDVFFTPSHYVPRFCPSPIVMSIMDLSYLKFPELFKAKDLHQLVHWTKYSVSHVERIFTISESSKHDIIETYHVPDDRVVVTYPGFTMPVASKSLPPFEELVKKYDISRNFILSVGTLQPRKNFVRLIEAFSLLIHEKNQKFTDLELVIIGKKGWLYEEILTAPKRYDVENKVKFLDFVADSDLSSFYRHALCFTLPSLYEGFGLPVLEAMAYKCPVVVSQVSSLPEIADKAGIYVDPESVKSIEEGLMTCLKELESAGGKKRVELGLDQVKKFTWEKAAKQTLAILEQLGGKTV